MTWPRSGSMNSWRPRTASRWWSGPSEPPRHCPNVFSWSRSSLQGPAAGACASARSRTTKSRHDRFESIALSARLKHRLSRLPRLRAMAAEFAIFRRVDLVVLATERCESLEKDREKPLSFRGGCHKWITHHSVRHLAASLGKHRIATDLGPEFETPFVLDRARHVDQIWPQIKLQTRLPLASVADATFVGLAPCLQLLSTPCSSRSAPPARHPLPRASSPPPRLAARCRRGR